MLPPAQLTGAVLAGGRSQRMGVDKAVLRCDGMPLWERQTRLLRAIDASPVGIVRRPDQAALPLPRETCLWLDAVSGIGPLAGLHVALENASTNWIAIVAVDLPRIEASWFHWLAAHCGPGRGAVAHHDDGIFEPLAAIYPRAALGIAAAQLPAADHSLQRVVRTLVGQGLLFPLAIPKDRRPQLVSWNTPDAMS